MAGLSVIITTLNEAEQIAGCLASVHFADEVLVIDAYSSDDTVAIARESGARVMRHEYYSPAAQKNWAIPLAAHNWILMLDADERVTPELEGEIRRVISETHSCNGYEIKRRNFFLGREIRYSGWQNDWVLRLFRKDRGQFQERQVHEQLIVNGSTKRLSGRLLHYSYRSLEDYWRKLRRYADWNAAEARRKGSRISPLYMMLHPPFRFFRSYIMRGGFLDGSAGLVVSLLTACYAAAKDARIWELQKAERSR